MSKNISTYNKIVLYTKGVSHTHGLALSTYIKLRSGKEH